MNPRASTAASLLLALFGTLGATAGGQDQRGAAGRAPQRPADSVPSIDVRTRVSRTTVSVGDRVIYHVELRCAPGVDVLLDDLLKQRVQIEGGEILSVEPERSENNGRITYRIEYTIVTFRVDAPAIHVAPVPVRFYARARGERPGDAAPAGEVTIPSLTVAVHSTIPDSEQAIQLRLPGDARTAPAYLRLAQPVGVGLLLLAIVPAAISTLGLWRRARALRASYVARRSRTRHRGSFEQIKSLQPGSDAERIDAYEQLDAFLRDHLSITTGIAAHSLTPAGTKRALEQRAPQIPPDAVEAVLAACERARYAPEPPSAADWSEVVRDAEAVLRTSPR